MESFELVDGALLRVPDPTYDDQISDVQESIAKAGYVPESSSEIEDGAGSEIRLYQLQPGRAAEGKPQFYIDIVGRYTGIASLIAYDFPQLIETLKYIHPLIALLGLDQVSTVHAETRVYAEEQARKAQR